MNSLYQRKYSVFSWATWLIIGFSLLVSSTLGASERVYSFSVVPQQSSTKLARTWVPLLQLLKMKTGVSLRFVTAPDIPTFESRLAGGEYDFAYMNPYHYTVYHQNPGYQAFARQADKKIRGILVVRKDSAYQAAEELKGQVIAFPAPAAFAATLLVRSYLNSLGVSYDPRFVSSHDSVYRAVAGEFAVAGGGIVRTLGSVDPEVRAQLRVLWKSPGYTPHAFAAHPRVPASVVEQVQQALGELINYPEGIDVLGKVNFKAIEKAGDSDWEDIRSLNIDAIKSVN